MRNHAVLASISEHMLLLMPYGEYFTYSCSSFVKFESQNMYSLSPRKFRHCQDCHSLFRLSQYDRAKDSHRSRHLVARVCAFRRLLAGAMLLEQAVRCQLVGNRMTPVEAIPKFTQEPNIVLSRRTLSFSRTRSEYLPVIFATL